MWETACELPVARGWNDVVPFMLSEQPKKIKTPLHILQGIRQKALKKEKQQREFDLAAGNFVAKKKATHTHTVRDDDIFKETKRSVGKMSRTGALRVSQAEVRAVHGQRRKFN